MDGIIRVLDYFAIISGLKINILKTKLVWIGSKKISKEVFHHTRLSNRKFDLLRIKFCTDLHELIDLNYQTKLDEIKNTLIQWNSRSLNPFGRLTLIKT